MMKFADTVIPRLNAANDALMAKGWKCPSIEIGFKVLGKYGPVIWASGHLDGDAGLKLPLITNETEMESLLDAIDKAVETVPSAMDKKAEINSALAKLTPSEKELLGLDRLEIERKLDSLRKQLGAA